MKWYKTGCQILLALAMIAREVLGNVLNPAMTYRLYQQQLIEVFLNISDLPTRSKLDEIHRSLDERCKDVKSIKKSLVDS